MAEERDAKVSQHYRGLQALEPPPELDQTIVAASRRVVSSPGRHRWYYSLAAAAVLVFAVALTLHIERERPDAEGPPQAAAAPQQLRREERLAPQYAPAPAAAPILVPAAPERPERWLERIAELRSRGKHADADKELVEFRRVYPSYPLSEVMRERVEGR